MGVARVSLWVELVNCQHTGTHRPASISCECDSHSPQSQLGHCVLGRPRRQHRHWLLHFPASMHHPSAPLTCVLGSLNIPPVTSSPTANPTPNLPSSSGRIWELCSLAQTALFILLPLSARMFKSPGLSLWPETRVRLPSSLSLSPCSDRMAPDSE